MSVNISPEVTNDVPVAAPISGVVSVGEVASTTAPVPVDDADRARVPAVVIGEPDTDMNEGTVIATDVTVPDPDPIVVHIGIEEP